MCNECNKWLDISSAPRDGTEILGGRLSRSEWGAEKWNTWVCWWRDPPKPLDGGSMVSHWVTQPGAFGCMPTHWTPLPLPPAPAA
jgi:hypothetical protein